MNTNNYKSATDKLVVKPNKALNRSNSDDSYEVYSEKDLEYLDKYKPLSLHRMEDEELYDIITKHNFNDEKITNEIKEFTKLLNHKGDDYGWNIIESGNSKNYFFIFRKKNLCK